MRISAKRVGQIEQFVDVAVGATVVVEFVGLVKKVLDDDR